APRRPTRRGLSPSAGARTELTSATRVSMAEELHCRRVTPAPLRRSHQLAHTGQRATVPRPEPPGTRYAPVGPGGPIMRSLMILALAAPLAVGLTAAPRQNTTRGTVAGVRVAPGNDVGE